MDLTLKLTLEKSCYYGSKWFGKSTLANVLTGKNGYKVEGQILYQGKDL
jgi:Fe-S cluster assembly ATPase SufC